MIAFIIVLLIVGFIVGAIARLLMPGRDPLGILGTIALGIAGSFVGGFCRTCSNTTRSAFTASTRSASSGRSSARGCCCSCCALPDLNLAAARLAAGRACWQGPGSGLRDCVRLPAISAGNYLRS
jgi:uncharacterized membrane protein YeaQ/YmgE (transglycosylase-associated protein family)